MQEKKKATRKEKVPKAPTRMSRRIRGLAPEDESAQGVGRPTHNKEKTSAQDHSVEEPSAKAQEAASEEAGSKTSNLESKQSNVVEDQTSNSQSVDGVAVSVGTPEPDTSLVPHELRVEGQVQASQDEDKPATKEAVKPVGEPATSLEKLVPRDPSQDLVPLTKSGSAPVTPSEIARRHEAMTKESPSGGVLAMRGDSGLKDQSIDAATPDSDPESIFVREQLSRWLRLPVRLVQARNVVYNWPQPAPDVSSCLQAALATSVLLTLAASVSDRDEAWIALLRPKRLGIPVICDLAETQVQLTRYTPREIVTVLQTLLWNGGFEFQNMINAWAGSKLSTIETSLIHELIEWRALTNGVPVYVTAVVDDLGPKPRAQLKNQDAEGDIFMSDAELEFLKTEYVLRLKVTGVRVRSPDESSMNPEAKKHASIEASSSVSAPLVPGDTSSQEPGSHRAEDSAKSSDESPLESNNSDSRGSSSSSSLMSLGHSAASHMPYGGPGAMVMTTQVQGGHVPIQGGGVIIARAVPSTRMLDQNLPSSQQPEPRTLVEGDGLDEGMEEQSDESMSASASVITSRRSSTKSRSLARATSSRSSRSRASSASSGRHKAP